MLKIPAYLTGFTSRADGSIGIRFTTQELSGEQFVDVKKRLNAYGWLLFDEADVVEADIPDDIPSDNRKTPGQRLRSVLFIIWKQDGEKGDFTDFYRYKMEQLIDHFKSKLDKDIS